MWLSATRTSNSRYISQVVKLVDRRAVALAVLAVALTCSAAFQSAGRKAAKPAAAVAARRTATSSPQASPLPAVRNAPDQAWTEQVLNAPFVGHVTAYVPKAPASAVVLFVSGDGGWNLGVVNMARRIMPKAIVIGLSYVALRKAHLNSQQCWMPAGDLEEISHTVQRELKLPAYHPPIVLGYSSGATLVYGVLASAPPTTFAGGMSLGFCPDLPSDHPVCSADNFKPTFDAKKNTAWLPKVSSVPREWYVLNGVQDEVCLPPETREFMSGIGGAHFIEIPGTGHGFGRPIRWGGPFDESIDKLIAGVGAPPAIASAVPAVPAPSVAPKLQGLGLPLEYRWADHARAAMIFLSGDGGWATLDDRVSSYLAAHGVSVVGISSLKYFWSQKTPEQAGRDVRGMAEILGETRVPIFVGGYSFGAEVSPFILATWADSARRGVAGEVLIAPGETASFEVSPLDWVFRAKATPRRVADAVRSLHIPTICVAGQQEAARDTACDDLGTAAESVRLPGSHHFNGKYDDVAKAVLTFIDKHE